MSQDAGIERSESAESNYNHKVEIKLYGHLHKFTSGPMGMYKTWVK